MFTAKSRLSIGKSRCGRVFTAIPSTFEGRMGRLITNHPVVVAAPASYGRDSRITSHHQMMRVVHEEIAPALILEGRNVIFLTIHYGFVIQPPGMASPRDTPQESVTKAIKALSSQNGLFVSLKCINWLFPRLNPHNEAEHKLREDLFELWNMVEERAKSGSRFIFVSEYSPADRIFSSFEIPLSAKPFFTAPAISYRMIFNKTDRYVDASMD